MQVYLPTNDLLFKKLLTSEDSQHILKAFVKDLLGLEFERLMPKQNYHIYSYKKSYEEREKMEVKLTEVDILAIAEDGSYTTIECQVQAQKYFRERSLFYLGEAYRSPFGNLAKNEVKKSNFSSLRPAYGINIVNFHLFDDTESALQLFRLMNPETNRLFLNKEGKELLVLCFLSLKNDVLNTQHAAYHWHYYFKTGEVKTDAPDYIKEAKKKTDFLTLEEEEKEMIMKIDKARAIAEAELEYARDEGMAKGLKIGMENGRQEEQKRNLEEKRVLLLNLMQTSLSLKEISEISGIDIETLKKWKAESE
jgi:predicted transposase/invertase (TIGR01784 family)